MSHENFVDPSGSLGEDSNLSADSTSSIPLSNDVDMDTPMDTSIAPEPEAVAAPVPVTPAPKSLIRVITDDTRHIVTEPKDIIEYEYPVKSGEKWFIQEQIGELLDIKSFSRKFPDLSRRKVDKDERDYLVLHFKIQDRLTETQLRDLCAMRSFEIHDLMASEYPGTYQEYQRVSADRLKAIMFEQAKEMEAIKNDSKRLAELRAKAIKSAQEYNHELQLAKAQERKHYWDIQTNIIQSSSNKWKKLPPKYTRVDPYPVAVILGQYQSYYKKFTPAEMRKLPLGTVLDGAQLYPVHREPSPPPINVSERDMQRFERMAIAQQQTPHAQHTTVNGTRPNPMETPKSDAVRKSSAPLIADKGKCLTCGEGPTFGQKFLRCASCPMQAHPECLDMTDDMIATVFTYPWNCIDCKKCTTCSKADREDSIMFCDRCDRGFHTFCVGLKDAPKGQWICESFCAIELRKGQQTPRVRSTRRGSAVAV